MKYKFRQLYAEEIDCRVNTINEKGLTLLLYKDARCDMNILDETVGEMNWQRDHKELKGNIYCGISIWDPEKEQWIIKWDCGKESFSEAEKGEASDSFKRAGFNWGIGRELYTSPFIWISATNYTPTEKNGKLITYDTFRVKQIRYNEDREIDGLVIVNNKTNKVVFEFGNIMSSDDIMGEMTIQEGQKQIIKELDKNLIKEYLKKVNKSKISELNYGEALELIKKGDK